MKSRTNDRTHYYDDDQQRQMGRKNSSFENDNDREQQGDNYQGERMMNRDHGYEDWQNSRNPARGERWQNDRGNDDMNSGNFSPRRFNDHNRFGPDRASGNADRRYESDERSGFGRDRWQQGSYGDGSMRTRKGFGGNMQNRFDQDGRAQQRNEGNSNFPDDNRYRNSGQDQRYGDDAFDRMSNRNYDSRYRQEQNMGDEMSDNRSDYGNQWGRTQGLNQDYQGRNNQGNHEDWNRRNMNRDNSYNRQNSQQYSQDDRNQHYGYDRNRSGDNNERFNNRMNQWDSESQRNYQENDRERWRNDADSNPNSRGTYGTSNYGNHPERNNGGTDFNSTNRYYSRTRSNDFFE